jgi:sodium transport system ATP-binding protein
MADIADRRCKGFSTGQTQRIALARALLHEPPNVILDEPTNGLDVVATKDMCDSIRRLRERGHCVLISTHQMKEAEQLCDDVAVIVKGKLVAFGTQQELVEKSGKRDLQSALVSFARAR